MIGKTATLFLFVALVLPQPGYVQPLNAATDASFQQKDLQYSCPMHPEVRSKSPGTCPKCGMELVRGSKAAKNASGDSKEGKPPDTHPSIQIPDTAVFDQDGQPRKFYTDLVKGRTVAINFLFTTCTTICPPMAATFRKVQTELGDRVGADIALISVTVDPNTDVPERLKGFLAKFKAGPGWTFVTGKKPEIDSLLRSLGAYVSDKNDHSPMILIGNESAAYWTRTYGLASADSIVKLIKDAAERKAEGKGGSAGLSPVTPPSIQPRGGEESPARRVEPSSQGTGSGTPTTGIQPRTTEKDTVSRSVAAAHYFTNLQLFTQDNKPVRFYEDMLKGKIVLVNFMFTTCTGICPPMTANLARVQTLLGEHIGREINMLSLTVDPLTDTPEKLKKYADSFKIKPGWYFLTGKKENIDWVVYRLGGYVEDKTEHSGLLLIGNDTTGEWIKVSAMTRPSDIAEAVMKWLEKKP